MRCVARPESQKNTMHSAHQQVVYVITGDSLQAAQRYVAGACLSMHSLRRFHPAASLVCACDRRMYQALHATSHPLLTLVDRLIECPDVSGGPVHRSRSIKTSLRGRLDGPFVYIDADTLISGPLDELFESQTDVGFTVDRFFPASPGAFPDWLMPFYSRLGWIPTDRYYSGGIFHVSTTAAADTLFSAWHALWRQTVAIGIVMDQPSLNRAIATTPHSMTLYSQSFNHFVGRVDQELPPDTRVISFLASQKTMALSYERLISRFVVDHVVDMEHIIALTSAGASYPRQRQGWSQLLLERLLVGSKFQATRYGLRDPRSE